MHAIIAAFLIEIRSNVLIILNIIKEYISGNMEMKFNKKYFVGITLCYTLVLKL